MLQSIMGSSDIKCLGNWNSVGPWINMATIRPVECEPEQGKRSEKKAGGLGRNVHQDK